MSGILEQLLAAIQANTAAVQAMTGVPQQYVQPQQGQIGGVVQQPQQQYVQPQQPAPMQQPQPNVTADTITALIQPHIANPALKDALGAAMRGMGINALPETQPHQYAALYAAFQNVIAQHAGGAPQQQPASASII